ncbi:MAG TPA: DUF3618 domain-containing protein [Gemmatimonadaceae bacterium]|nr:DUF3618 domain-containing protein [Gemmatimonadaceae bacterium]
MSERTADVRREIAETRAQMSETVSEIESRVSAGVRGVTEKLDVIEWARQHPWPALAVAFGLGLGLSASGADARAARATAGAAKRAPGAATGAAKRWQERRRERAAEKAAHRADEEASSPSAFGRLTSGIGAHVRGGVDQIVGEMRDAAEEMNPPAVQTETLRNGAWTNGRTAMGPRAGLCSGSPRSRG